MIFFQICEFTFLLQCIRKSLLNFLMLAFLTRSVQNAN